MKNQLFLFGLLLLMSNWAFAQGPSLSWAKSMGSTGWTDHGNAIAIDPSGNVYTIGSFSGTVDFDPSAAVFNLSTSGTFDMDMYIQKLNANGNLIWAKSIKADAGWGINLDNSGNILITGIFTSIVDFDPSAAVTNLTSNGGVDAFVLKLTTNGTFVWAKSFGNTLPNVGVGIVSDKFGNTYITGTFHGTVDFNPGAAVNNLTSNGVEDVFVLKLDINGNFVWVRSFGGISAEHVCEIILDSNNNVFVAGSFYNTVDFNVNADIYNVSSNGERDIYILKLDALGNYIWVRTMGAGGRDVAEGIAVDASNNIYTTGSFSNTVDFDPSTSTSNLVASTFYSAFVQKLSNSGTLVWAKCIGGTGTAKAEGCGISINAAGEVYTTGVFQNTVDFNPNTAVNNITAVSGQDAYVQKMNSNGIYMWSFNINSGGYGPYLSISTASCQFYLTGNFSSTADFSPGTTVTNLTSNGNTDAFVAKYQEGTQGYNSTFTYDVKCDANGNAKLTVTGPPQPIGNPYYVFYLIEDGASTPTETINWWQQASPYVYSPGPFTFSTPLQAGIQYYVKYGVWDDCTAWGETRIYNIDAGEAAPEPAFHLRNATTSATTFLTCDPINLVETYEASHGLNYNRYYIDLWERSCGSSTSFSWKAASGWFYTTLPSTLDIRALFSGVVFTAGKEYQVKLALGNECDGWEDTTANFCVVACAAAKSAEQNNNISNEALHDDFEIKLYPNPAQSTININAEGVEITELSIFNSLGQEFQLIKYTSNQLEISALPSGMYILELKTDKGLIRKQFVKQ